MKGLTLLPIVSLLLVGFILQPAFSADRRVGPDYIYPTSSGAINPDITQNNINQNICKKGWSTKGIRPSTSYTNKIKLELLKKSQYKDKAPSDYELDHIIPLEIGGAPKDRGNLWLEPYNTRINSKTTGARQKDIVENSLHSEVCVGVVKLKQAQKIITEDWYGCYIKIKSGKICNYQ